MKFVDRVKVVKWMIVEREFDSRVRRVLKKVVVEDVRFMKKDFCNLVFEI